MNNKTLLTLVFTLSAIITGLIAVNSAHARSLDCSTMTVQVSFVHTMEITTCEDGSGTVLHRYPGGLYCVSTWDGNGAQYNGCTDLGN